jgi:hypothetical protein
LAAHEFEFVGEFADDVADRPDEWRVDVETAADRIASQD